MDEGHNSESGVTGAEGADEPEEAGYEGALENEVDQYQEDGLQYFQGEDGEWYVYQANPDEMEAPAEVAADPTGPATVVEVNDATPLLPVPQAAEPQSAGGLHSEQYAAPISIVMAEESYGWLAVFGMNIFFSTLFRLYFTVMLYCAAVLITMLSLQYSFALLMRLFFSPSGGIEPFAYLAMFLFYSFIATSVWSLVSDAFRYTWTQKRTDKYFLGFRNIVWDTEPPYIIYWCIIIITLVLPVVWGIVEAIIDSQSIVFVAQRFANVSVLATVVFIAICYIYFFIRAIRYKHESRFKRKERDDFELRTVAYEKEPLKLYKSHWYHSSTVLEEYGLDRLTILYTPIVLLIGLAPLFAIYIIQSLASYNGDPSLLWSIVAAVGFAAALINSWLTRLRRNGQWSAYGTVALIAILLILGVAGAATSDKPASGVVVFGLFVFSQGMLTRKRKHFLTRKEIETLIPEEVSSPPAPNPPYRKGVQFDDYLCCCRRILWTCTCLPCCSDCACCTNRREMRSERVIQIEKMLARKRVALRTDQKVLLLWWLFIMILVAFAVALGNGVQNNFSSSIAAASGVSTSGEDSSNPLCALQFNTNATDPFTVVDMALLGALSYTYGSIGDTDFATWFGTRSSFHRVYPRRLPPNIEYATDGVSILFSDYLDFETNYHIITLNSNSRGVGVFRYIDDWGASLALQGAAALSPLISIWPVEYKSAFVRTSDVYHSWLPPYDALSRVTAYIKELLNDVSTDQILIVGDEFNGGYAKILSSDLGISFVVFNAPGTRYTLNEESLSGIQVNSDRSLWSYVDSVEDTRQTFLMPCSTSDSANKCSSVSTTIDYVTSTCGDPLGRSMV